MLRLINWIETLDAITQLDRSVQSEVMGFIEELVIPQRQAGSVDPVFGRSVQFEIRPNLLLFCDVDRVVSTVEVLSLELLVSKAPLAT